jgi:HEAT repeat protein
MTPKSCVNKNDLDLITEQEKHDPSSVIDSRPSSECHSFGTSTMAGLSSSDATRRREALLEIISDRLAGYRVRISNLMLQDESAEVRTLAAYALDRLGADAATPALLRALSDPCFSVRSAAGWALVQVCADAPENVQSVLNASCDPYAREMAKLVLERLPNPLPSATRGNTIKTKLEAEGSAANLDDLSPNHLRAGPDSNESELEKVKSQLLLHLEYEHDMRNAVGRVALALHELRKTSLTKEQSEAVMGISVNCECLRGLFDESAKTFRSSGLRLA